MTSALLRWLGWYLGLPPSAPGEGTVWRLEASAPPGSLGAWPTVAWVGAAAAGLIVLVYLRDSGRLSLLRRVGLIGLRLTVLMLLLVMLAQVSVRVDRTELPSVAVLIDVSASMGLSDQYRDSRLAAAVQELVPDASASPSPSERRRNGPEAATRLQLVQGILTRGDGAWLRRLEQTHQVRLYTFDEHLRPLLREPAGVTGVPVAGETAAMLAGLTASGPQTAPATALRELLDEYRGRPLSAVVLFTDGVSTRGEDEQLSAAATLARERGTPLYPIGVGSEEPARDVELYDLLAEEVIYVGDPVTLSMRLRSFGYAGHAVDIVVSAEGEAGPLAARTVTLPADGTPLTEELTFVPQQEGEYRLTVSAGPLAGETDPDNNRVQRTIIVRRDQFHVLLVEGPPRWEYRTLKPVLERDDTIRLETYLQEADLNYAPEDRTALAAFPATLEQLSGYDVVIWGDVDLHELDRNVPERLRQFVADQGGGLILIAGERNNPLNYTGTALETLLPVRLRPGAAEGSDAVLSSARFRLQRTPEGRAWPMLRLADHPADDEAAWRSLPAEIDWCAPVRDLKPGALLLAVRPLDGAGDAAQPVIVHQRYGRGQVLFHGIDATWTWRKRVEDRYFGRYWLQAVRTVAAARVRRSTTGRELTTDRKIYQPGEEVHLRLRGATRVAEDVPAGAGRGTGEQVAIESAGGRRVVVPLAPRAGEVLVWEGTVRGLTLGPHTARVVTVDPEQTAPSCSFLVEQPNRELRDRIIAKQDLQRAAKTSHGEFHMFPDADRVPAEIPHGRAVRVTQSRPIPLWNRAELLVLLIGVLSAEWILRKRSRLV